VAYVLSRIAFLATHVVFAYWLLFITNDPLSLGLNTLDSKEIKDSKKCESFNTENAIYNVALFVICFWLPHSGLARQKVKKILGLWESPLDRPIFAVIAPFCWLLTLVYWKPVTNCAKLDLLAFLGTPDGVRNVSIMLVIWSLALILMLGFFYLMPDHVFGTAKYKLVDNPAPKVHKILIGFPYAIVRHPAAAAFLWMYWSYVALLNPTANAILLSAIWSVFIVVGTLVFEEGGLKKWEFGNSYLKYSAKVNAFWPSLWSLKWLFVGGTIELKKD